jgi:hypothetical protein
MKKNLIVLWILMIVGAQAQTPPASSANDVESSLKIKEIKMEKATLPGATEPWVKIVCTYVTTKSWTDNVVFVFDALLKKEGENEKGKIASGTLRYTNIPGGINVAIAYMSPNAAKRFGSPQYIKVVSYAGEDEAGSFEWSEGGKKPAENWTQHYNKTNGALLPVTVTPWSSLEYSRGADIAGN